MIYNEICKVISNDEISKGIYKTVLHAPSISVNSHPGQFINILPSSDWDHVMRRPMSIANQANDEISIIYKAIGIGTSIMVKWKLGEMVDIIGPLGNFWIGYDNSFPILIGGGVGIAPILNLHHHLLENNINHILIMGVRNRREHFLKHEPEKQIYMSTDDASLGIAGNVLDALLSIYSNEKHPQDCKIFSCGPPIMMESIRSYSLKHDLECDLALETIMACGFGICQGCTVERKAETDGQHTYRNKFALACMDGPIFNAKGIVSCM